MQKKWKLLIVVFFTLILVACGKQSQQQVTEQAVKKWLNSSYDIEATMEVKTAPNPRIYAIEVWHTVPTYYRVQVKQQGESDNPEQIIVRNDEGVFVVSPALQKTYKFQSEWPTKNSQAYIINTLATDLQADKDAKMTETEAHYIFDVAMRSGEQTKLARQTIYINKDSMLPEKVSIFNDAQEEQVLITFKRIDFNKKRQKEDYAVEKFEENEQNDTAGIAPTQFEIYYPDVQLPNTILADEKILENDGVQRSILTFEGDKAFTLMQTPSVQKAMPVFAAGDLVDLGFAVSAITPNSISWEQNGMSFFIASTKLTEQEFIQVASTMIQGSLK